MATDHHHRRVRRTVRPIGAGLGPAARYWLFQLPGWLLVGSITGLLHQLDLISGMTALLVLGLWLAKDLLLFPVLKEAFSAQVPADTERLVGATAKVATPIRGTGYVRIGGELWRARFAESVTIPAGARVRVTGAQGLTLMVVPEERAQETGHGDPPGER